MVLAFSAFLIRHGTAEKRAEEAEQRPLEGVEEEEAMTRYQKILFWLNGPCIFCIFEDAVTCSGASVPENVQKPPRLCTKVGGLTPIGPRFRGDSVSIFRRAWPLGGDCRGDRLKSI